MHVEMPVLTQTDPCYLISQLTSRGCPSWTQMVVDSHTRDFISLNMRECGREGNNIFIRGTYCYGILSLCVRLHVHRHLYIKLFLRS